MKQPVGFPVGFIGTVVSGTVRAPGIGTAVADKGEMFQLFAKEFPAVFIEVGSRGFSF